MSFRRRLTLLIAGAVAGAIVIVAATAYLLTRSELRGQIDDSLEERADVVRGIPERPMPPPGGPGGPGGPDLLPPNSPLTGPATIGQLVDAEGRVLASRGLDGGELPTEAAVALLPFADPSPVFEDVRVEGVELRMITVALGPDRALQLARSLEEVDDALARLALILALIAAGGVGAAAGLGFIVAGAALGPVKRLTETSEEVARTEDLTRRIEIEGEDELARLGSSFNAMMAALERSIGAQRQLVADASHELRTPLTSLRTNIETLARSPQMPERDRRRLLADLEAEVEELGRLIDDTVVLARDGAEAVRSEAVEMRLDEIVTAAVERARRRAESIEIAAELEPALLRGRPDRIDRAVGNLLDNAVKWAGRDGRIEVTLSGGELTVADSGPGIEEADLPHVFDRFYRAAGARGTPGSGLGLAIVKQVAEAHGGEVAAGHGGLGGAELKLRLPTERTGL